jgi:hypothetical protein
MLGQRSVASFDRRSRRRRCWLHVLTMLLHCAKGLWTGYLTELSRAYESLWALALGDSEPLRGNVMMAARRSLERENFIRRASA